MVCRIVQLASSLVAVTMLSSCTGADTESGDFSHSSEEAALNDTLANGEAATPTDEGGDPNLQTPKQTEIDADFVATPLGSDGTPERPTHLKRPEGIMDSPGPTMNQNWKVLTPGDVVGNWWFASVDSDVSLILLAEGQTSAGDVELVGAWPFSGAPPVTWIYLSLGQMTLLDADSQTVWRGIRNGETSFAAFLADGETEVQMTRAKP